MEPVRNRTRALLLVALAVTIAVYVTAFLISTTRDRPDQIDTEALVDVVNAACIDLRTEVDAQPALPPGAGPKARRERVDEQGRVIAAFLDQVRTAGEPVLDADVPARAWLADWEALQTARETWAERATGAFTVPVVDERALDSRIESIGVDACVVPEALTVAP